MLLWHDVDAQHYQEPETVLVESYIKDAISSSILVNNGEYLCAVGKQLQYNYLDLSYLDRFVQALPTALSRQQIDEAIEDAILHLDTLEPSLRLYACNAIAFKKLSEHIELYRQSSSEKIYAEIIEGLEAITQNYFDCKAWAYFHSFSFLISSLQYIDDLYVRDLVLVKIQELALLNERLVHFMLNKPAMMGADNFVKARLDSSMIKQILEYLLCRIDTVRCCSIAQRFDGTVEKTLEQQVLETLQAIHVANLNQLAKVLTEVFNEWLSEEMPPDIVKNPGDVDLKERNVVIFTCSYGTGHKITASAVKQALDQTGARSAIYDLSTGALLGRDRWRMLFKFLGVNYEDHPLCGVDIFNEVLRHQLYVIINTKDSLEAFVRQLLDIPGKSGVAAPSDIFTNSWEKTQIREILLLERPDHIVTTYHMDLNPILEVAQELGIPLLHIPTDYNMKYKEVFRDTTPEYPHFKSLVPNTDIQATLETKYPLNDEQLMKDVGVPLRLDFYQTLSPEEQHIYRQYHHVEDGAKVLYLSAGGNGQNLPHPAFLANSQTWQIPLHIMVVAGRNRSFVEQLQETLSAKKGQPYLLKGSNPYVTVEIIRNPDSLLVGTDKEFFLDAADLSKILDITDVSIAKAGGLSVSELLFKGVPILFDQRKTPFSWEIFNIEVATAQHMGCSNFDLKDLEHDLQETLTLPKQHNMHFHFENGYIRLIETIAEQISTAEAVMKMPDSPYVKAATGALPRTPPKDPWPFGNPFFVSIQ
jgi:UDP-N-acetylglucosamine:LPS N-acetylglucosamine transferase